MKRAGRILITLIVFGAGFLPLPSVAQAIPALPSTTPSNSGMVDFPTSGETIPTVYTIAQAGDNVWVGGAFSDIDDANGNKVADAANLAPFSASTGSLVSGIHIPLVTLASGGAEIYDSSLGPDGLLYFAGNFDAVDGLARNNVAAIDPATGQLAPFAPKAGTAWAVLATGSAIYVGTDRLLSFQLDGTPTPGFTPPVSYIDASLRQEVTAPQFRDIQILGNTLVAACHCDSLSDTNGTRDVKAVVEIDATTGNWIPWVPASLKTQSGAYGIAVIIHNYPGTNTPTVYLAAGGSDFTAAYDFETGARDFWTDTSGSSQAITWYQGSIIVGGHFEWTESPLSDSCQNNMNPNPLCYFSPKLVAMDPTDGHVILDANGQPWNPGICCVYQGVWALLVGSDGSTLHVGGAFTEAGGSWKSTCQTFKAWCLSGASLQRYYARFSGPASPTHTLAVALAGTGLGTVTSSPDGIDCGSSCSQDFATLTDVTLTAQAQPGSTFTGWSSVDSGFSCPGTDPCTVTMDQDRSVTATFAPISFQLTVTKAGTGTGTVTSSPAGIKCGTTCSSFFLQGTPVTLTATPGTNSAFAGWSSDCTGTGTCQVTMDQDRSVVATFNSTKQSLTVIKTGAGVGSITSDPAGISCGSACTHRYSTATVTLTATAGGNSAFNGWSSADPGFSCPGTGPCTVTMDMPRTISADFEAATKIFVNVTGTGGGLVTSAPAGVNCTTTMGSCTTRFVTGTTVTLTPTPDANSVFTGWSGSCSGTAECVLTASGTLAQRTVTATFVSGQTLTVAPGGTGSGEIESDPAGIDCGLRCQAAFLTGTPVTLTAYPDPTSSYFSGWTGDCAGTSDSCQVTMDQARNVIATFTPLPRQLNVAVVGNGTVTSNPAGIDCITGTNGVCYLQSDNGSDVELYASPDPNWAFTGWSGACSGTDPDCVVTMDSDESVTATFAPISRTLSVSFDGNGNGSVMSSPAGIDCPGVCAASFNQGTAVTLHPSEAEGSAFTGWSGDCTNSTGDCSLTIDGVKNVVATFEPLFTLTVDTTGPGTVTSDTGGIACPTDCTASYIQGTMVTLTSQAASGNIFDGWSGDCTGSDATCVVTMDTARSVAANFATSESLSVSITGSGSGAVTSDPARISCATGDTGTCTSEFSLNGQVALTATSDAGSAFTAWGGDCAGTVGTICQVTMDAAKNVTAAFDLVPRELTVNVTGSGSVTSDTGGIACPGTCSASYPNGTLVTLTASASASYSFTGWSGIGVSCSGTAPCRVTLDADKTVTATFTPISTTIDDGSPAVSYNGWGGVLDPTANGGAYRKSSVKGDKATWTSPITTSLTWVTRTGPDQGNARVTIDGASKGTVDLYSASAQPLSKVFSGLVSKVHTVVINVLGTKNAASTGVGVAVDAFVSGATTDQESSTNIQYDGWSATVDAKASGGSYRSASVSTATAKLTFTGTSVDWITTMGTGCGEASVTIDGVSKGTVDLYGATKKWQVPFTYGGLSPGSHTIVIQVLGQKNASSTGNKVVVDGFRVWP